MNADSRTKQGKYIRDWEGQLSPTAAKLLQQHDYTIGINYLQKKAMYVHCLLFMSKLSTIFRLIMFNYSHSSDCVPSGLPS